LESMLAVKGGLDERLLVLRKGEEPLVGGVGRGLGPCLKGLGGIATPGRFRFRLPQTMLLADSKPAGGVSRRTKPKDSQHTESILNNGDTIFDIVGLHAGIGAWKTVQGS
jgi:hypothetical protein